MTGRAEIGWLRRLGQWLRPYRLQVALAMLLAVVGQGLLALIPLVQQVVVDRIMSDHTVPLGGWILILCAIGVVSFASHAIRRYLGSRCAVDVQHDLRVALHRHLHTLDIRRYRELAAGDVISRSTADLNLLQMFISQVPLFLANITLLTVGLVVMAVLSPLLFTVVALSLPVLAWATYRLRRELFPASFSDQVLLGQVANVVDEEIHGVDLIRAYGRQHQRSQHFADRAGRLYSSRLRTAAISARWTSLMTAIPAFTQLAVLGAGGALALRHNISLGVFLAFASYVLQFSAPTRLLAAMVTTTQLARSGAQRVFTLLDTTPTIPAAGDPLTQPGGGIELCGVDLDIDDAPVLRSVTASFRPAEYVAVVGPSGAGKTTLGMLLARQLDPTDGAVLVGGQDISRVAPGHLRRSVVMVFDDAPLYAGSIWDNIALGRPDASDEHVRAAAESAGASEFIDRMPMGYHTAVGTGGTELSGGQAQRLALARAYLHDPEILILDDVTSALDAHTERKVLNGLGANRAGRLTIVLTHRPAVIAQADRIFVLDAGQIVATGSLDSVAEHPYVQALRNQQPVDAADGHVDELHPAQTGSAARPSSTDSWPDPAESGDDAALYAQLGIDTQESGRQVRSLDPRLRDAVLRLPALPPKSRIPDDPLPNEVDDRIFSMAGSLRPVRWVMVAVLVLVLFDTATTLAIPFAFRFGIDNGVTPERWETFWLTCLGLCGVVVVSWGNSWVLFLRAAKLSERILYTLRQRLFRHLQRLPIDYFDRNQAGSILTRLTTDVDAVAQLMSQGMVNALANAVTCLGVLAVLIALDWRLALAMLVLVPPLALASWIFIRGSVRAYRTARGRIAEVATQMSDHLGRLAITQTYGAQSELTDRFADRSRAYRDARRQSMLYVSVFFPFMNLLAVLAKALILLVGAHLMGADALTVGVLVAALLYVDQFFTPLQQLSIVLDLWIQARVGTQRMRDLLTSPVEPNAPAAAVPRPPVSTMPSADVELNDVGFAYRSSQGHSTQSDALAGITMTLPSGSTTAVVGSTGAGKSTLMKLLLGFYRPDRGRIQMAGVGVEHNSQSGSVAYVSQRPYLFQGTVASNIAFGKPGATQADIERAARSVGAHESIATLPLGYQTPVGAGRATLSAGQQQIICLARAELVAPQLLILDEATAHLDPIAEAAVLQALERVAARRTTVIVAHRLTTAARADTVVVLSGGRVVQVGSHDLLVNEPGRYRELWQAHTESSLPPIVNLSN